MYIQVDTVKGLWIHNEQIWMELASDKYLFQITYYFFAIIGMELFGGLITFYGIDAKTHPFCGNPALNNTYFSTFHYCNNNFNDFLRSLVVLFELMVVNQWHDILYLYITLGTCVKRSRKVKVDFNKCDAGKCEN